ncbi:hypothetical protein PMAYCL1PPCAC_05382, partial [Pristionchus mayeri]
NRPEMGQSNAKLDVAAALERQQQAQFEAQLAAADLALVRKHALKAARRREHFHWEALAAGTITACFVVVGAMTKTMKEVMIPITIVMMGMGTRYDISIGEQVEIIRDNAEKMLKESPKLLSRPGGSITISEIDQLRAEMFGSS